MDLAQGLVSVAGGAGGTSTYTTPGGVGSPGRIRVDGDLTSSETAFFPELGYAGDGYIAMGTSRATVQPTRVCEWLDFEATWTAAAGADVTVDITDGSGDNVLSSDVGDAQDLSDDTALDGVDDIGVRFTLTSDGSATPVVESWQIRWYGE